MSRHHVVCHDCPAEGLTDCEGFAASFVALHMFGRGHSVEYGVVAE